MKRLLTIISFLFFSFIPFLNPKSTFAVCPTICGDCTTQLICLSPCVWNTTCSDPTPTTTPTPQPSWWTQFWNWVSGLFIKTDYVINPNRSPEQINSDMTDYGVKNEATFSAKHSFAGSRLTDLNSQNCFKGKVIKETILKTNDYSNIEIGQICFNSNNCVVVPINGSTENLTGCKTKYISDLTNYLVQLQKPFYCDDSNQLIDIEAKVIDLTINFNEKNVLTIPENEKVCYQQIYNDLYLTPKDNISEYEENAKNMIQTPISNKYQKEGASNSDLQKQLDQNFSPDGFSAGLSGLRPENDK